MRGWSFISGRTLQVQCPNNARPGMTVRIVPPPSLLGPPAGMQSATDINRPPESRNTNTNNNDSNRKTVNQTFEVTVPNGVRPNQPFSLIAGGQRVLVTCPPNARPGTRIRFNLPISVSGPADKGNNKKTSPITCAKDDGATIMKQLVSYLF